MQIQSGLDVTVVKSNGKKETISGTTPHFEALVLNKEGKLSVEYAKARTAINADHALNFPKNQALAKRLRKECKKVVVEMLGGKVSTAFVEGEKRLLVTFPDQTVARL